MAKKASKKMFVLWHKEYEERENDFESVEEALEYINDYNFLPSEVEIREYDFVKVHKVKAVTEEILEKRTVTKVALK